MKTKKINLMILSALIAMSLAMLAAPTLAQRGNVRTNTKILYHNGPIMLGISNVYLIWYGNWAGNSATDVLRDLVSSIGGSRYFAINTLYPDINGDGPLAVVYSGYADDPYSHGAILTESDIEAVISDQIDALHLPIDPTGIYLVIASSDVVDTHPDGTSFCTPNALPYHGAFFYTGGTRVNYGFIGNPRRCPTSAAPQFFDSNGNQIPSPNGDIYADAMASTMAYLFDVITTDPTGAGWFDRYGLENADKCQGTFGQTYTTANGARANMHLGNRDFLIQQNWVNAPHKGYCGLSLP